MGRIRKKKQASPLVRFSCIISPATLYPEARAKFLAAEAQRGDPGWKWEAVMVNAEKGLWAVQYTDEDGHTERVEF